jgi:hypothetical protein
MSKAIWRGVVVGGATGVVLSFVWSYRRDDTVDMALGRATRMGGVFAAAGAVLGAVIDRRSRPRAPAPRWTTGLPAGQSFERGLDTLGRAAEVARPRVEQAVEAARPRVEQAVEVTRPRLGQAVEVARPRVEQAVEVARPRVEQAVEVARPRVEQAVEVARPRVEQALEVARVVADGRRRGWRPRRGMSLGEVVEARGGVRRGAAKPLAAR